jgi:hypothetical protein
MLGSILLLGPSKMSKMVSFGLLRGFMGPFMIAIEGTYGDELAGLLSWWDMPCCIEGNFNVTRFPSEKSGVEHFSPAMMEFSRTLGHFSKALVWACGFSKQLVLKSVFGFKRRVGFVAGRVL